MGEKYTVENALFEIWGALQVANNTWEVRTIAETAMKRCGALEDNKNKEEELPL